MVPHGFRADALIAACLLALGQAELWGGWRAGGDGPAFNGSRLAETVLIALVTLPVAWRRRRPVLAAAVVCVALAIHVLFVSPEVSFLAGLLPFAVMIYSLASWGPARTRLLGLAGVIATQVVLASQIAEMRSTGEILFGTFVIAGTWFVGDLARAHRQRASSSAARARELEAERAEWRRAAIAEERGRIARELHDVIAHSVSLMGVQAGAARTQLESHPERAREALHAVEATARESVRELRLLLGVLREGDPQPGLEPQPGLDQIESLVAQVRSAGLPASLSVEGEARAVPAGVALSAYRIVQEALTNTVKHAGDASAQVRVRYSTEAVEVEIRDNGAGEAARNGGRGHGLIGMRERAALYGGTLEAGSDADGGFAVRAWLPFEAQDR